jgi:hypothetical protein
VEARVPGDEDVADVVWMIEDGVPAAWELEVDDVAVTACETLQEPDAIADELKGETSGESGSGAGRELVGH